jgi:hypothetical protein
MGYSASASLALGYIFNSESEKDFKLYDEDWEEIPYPWRDDSEDSSWEQAARYLCSKLPEAPEFTDGYDANDWLRKHQGVWFEQFGYEYDSQALVIEMTEDSYPTTPEKLDSIFFENVRQNEARGRDKMEWALDVLGLEPIDDRSPAWILLVSYG